MLRSGIVRVCTTAVRATQLRAAAPVRFLANYNSNSSSNANSNANSSMRANTTTSAPGALGDVSEQRARDRVAHGKSADGDQVPRANSDSPRKSSIDQQAGADTSSSRTAALNRNMKEKDSSQQGSGWGQGLDMSKDKASSVDNTKQSMDYKSSASPGTHRINKEQNPGLNASSSLADDACEGKDSDSQRSVVSLIKSQHREIKSLLERVSTTRGREREQAFEQLQTLLLAHEAAEEQVVHPGAAGAGAGTDERMKEEQEATKMLAKLKTMKVDSVEFEQAFKQLKNDVTKHAEAEEREELARLSETKDRRELASMRQKVERVEHDHGVDVSKSGSKFRSGQGAKLSGDRVSAEYLHNA
eukprot:m.249216 g.249216  ORF g.249216 m.249216 type:complete len:359 (-) comp66242_c0_seq1:125-1201(-)